MIEVLIMSYGHRALVLLLLYLASSWLFAVVEGQKEAAACSQEGQVRATTESLQTNGTCTVVNLTNIQVCENGGWREICDEDFTDNDAKVICRELNYSDIGAVATRLTGQLLGGFATINSPMCNGMESMLSECGTVMSDATTESGSCVYTKVVARCFPKASDNCVSTERPQTTDGASSEAVSSATSSGSTHSTSEPSRSPTTPSTVGHTTNTGSVMTNLQPPTKQPNIVPILASVGVVFVLALIVSVLLMVILVGMCYKRSRREKSTQISPDSPVKIRKSDETDSKDLESGMYSELNNTVVQHQVPIYDTVKNKTKSQNLSEASVSENNDEDHTYAALNHEEIYTQISPHLGAGNSSTLPAGLTGFSSASSYYQKLDRTRSLPRTPASGSSGSSHNLPCAVNRTALALESGNIEEADLASPTSNASVKYPSPRGSPKQRPSPRGSPKQRTSSSHSSTSKDDSPLTYNLTNANNENFYHILDQEGSSASSDRDRERYDIDSQVSTDAVCNLGDYEHRQPQCHSNRHNVRGGTAADGGLQIYAVLEPSARAQLTPPTRHESRQRSHSAVNNRSSPPQQKRTGSNREAVLNNQRMITSNNSTCKYIQPSFPPKVAEIVDDYDPQMDTLV